MKLKFKITGLDCPNCAAKLAAKMEETNGIDAAKINILTEKLTIETSLDAAEAEAAIRKTAAAFSDAVVIG